MLIRTDEAYSWAWFVRHSYWMWGFGFLLGFALGWANAVWFWVLHRWAKREELDGQSARILWRDEAEKEAAHFRRTA